MKKLNFFILFSVLFFFNSCQKEMNQKASNETEFNSSFDIFETPSIPCSNGKPRIHPSATNRFNQETFIAEITTSASFDWNAAMSAMYGTPIFAAGVYGENQNEKSLMVPVYNGVTSEVTAIAKISKINNQLAYKFVDRKFHNYYKLKNNNLGTKYYEHYFQVFDFALCKNDIFPQSINNDFNGVSDGVVYMEECYSVSTQTYTYDCGYAVKGKDIVETRSDCEIEVTEVFLTSIPCPPGGGNGPGGSPGSGPGSGPGNGTGGGDGNGTGSNNSNNNGSNNNGLSETIYKAATNQAITTLCSISDPACVASKLLKSRGCDGALQSIAKFISDNNFNAVSICIASQKLDDLEKQTQSNNAACGQNLNLPNLNNITSSINANLLNAANSFPQLNDIICGLANNNLYPIVRQNLSNAINDYLSPILNNPNAPSGTGGTGVPAIPVAMLINIEKLTDLTILLSSNLLEKRNFEYLLNNPIELSSLSNYIYNSTESSKINICLEHIFEVANNVSYANFQKIHIQSGNSNLVWWLDDNWISSTNNFQLNVVDGTNQYSHLTAQEKVLVGLFPTQAYIIKSNVDVALNAPSQFMGTGGSDHNTKKDAFRHAFFNAINTRDVTPRIFPVPIPSSAIVKLFATAHESEVPSNLLLEKEMDLFNNEVGINHCQFCFPLTTTNNQIGNDILNKLLAGDLRYLSPLDTNSEIIPNLTMLIPTNQ